jgi:hypothetical protein
LEPIKNRLPTAVPSGVVTSITSSSVPAGTVAVNGTENIESTWSGMLSSPEVASNVRMPLGNGAPLSVYRLTVNGCPVPVPELAS